MIVEVDIKKLIANKKNPRIIRDEKFIKLVNSIKEFPQMLKLRPIVVNDEMVVLGGNMRLKACHEAGLKKVHIIKATDLSEAQQKEFIIKDNVGFGEWDWDVLANEWDNAKLTDWGLEVWQDESEVDYSILDDAEIDQELTDMTAGVKKAIQIEFDIEHYSEATEIVNFWRKEGAYVGKMILDYLKMEKEKI